MLHPFNTNSQQGSYSREFVYLFVAGLVDIPIGLRVIVQDSLAPTVVVVEVAFGHAAAWWLVAVTPEVGAVILRWLGGRGWERVVGVVTVDRGCHDGFSGRDSLTDAATVASCEVVEDIHE